MPSLSEVTFTPVSGPVHLPTEILTHILSFISCYDSATLASCCLTCRLFYLASIAKFYERPLISGRNFDQFAATICPPLKARAQKHNLGDFVTHLDLSTLVHESSPSTTARLLGRVKKRLTGFVAPAASFSKNSLIPLFKCKNLEFLDLSLVRDDVVIDTGIFYPARRLPSLRHLAVRTSSTNYGLSPAHPLPSIGYPSSLTHLHISGYLNDGPLNAIFAGDDPARHLWPNSITEVTLMDCLEPKSNVHGVFRNEVNMISLFLSATPIASTLRKLFISEHIWDIDPRAAVDLDVYTPNLVSLSVSCSLQVNRLGTGGSSPRDSTLWSHLEHLEILGTSHTSRSGNFDDEGRNLYSGERLMFAAKYLLPSLWRINYHSYTERDANFIQRWETTPLLRRNAQRLNSEGREQSIRVEEEAGLFMVVKKKGRWQGSTGWDPKEPRYESETLVVVESSGMKISEEEMAMDHESPTRFS